MLNLKSIKINKILKFIFKKFSLKLKLNQNLKAKIKASKGDKEKKIKLWKLKIKLFFKKSLTASENGWKIPINLTLRGPLRFWLKAIIFRSSNVIKATLIRTGIII